LIVEDRTQPANLVVVVRNFKFAKIRSSRLPSLEGVQESLSEAVCVGRLRYIVEAKRCKQKRSNTQVIENSSTSRKQRW